MSELSPKARALLEAARRDHGPNEDDRERVLAGLHASLGIAGALPTLLDASTANAGSSGASPLTPHAPSVPPPPPVALPDVLVQPAASKALGWSKLLAWKAGKVYLATLVIGGSAVGASLVPRAEEAGPMRRSAAMVAPREGHEPPSDAVAPAPFQAPRAEPTEPAAVANVEQPALEAVALSAAQPARDARGVQKTSTARVAGAGEGRVPARLTRAQERRETRRREREERAILAQDNTPDVPEAKPLAPAEDLASAVGIGGPPSAELALIRAALTSLRDRDAGQALRLLDEHAARYPSSAFSTERRALHVVALCAAGRHEEGSRERAQFLKSSGDSPIAARVRGACSR